MFRQPENQNLLHDLGIPAAQEKRVVIVGGGFAGLKLARKLSRRKYQVVLLDKNNYHCFQPLLYQISMGGLEPDSIAFPLRKWLRRKKAYFRMSKVLDVLPEENKLVTEDGDLSFDFLIIATGSKPNFFGNKGLEKHALTLKAIPGALDIRSWIYQKLEDAVLEKRVKPFLNIVIVGGGPTGVEIAGAMADLKNHVLPKDYAELSFQGLRIFLIESGDKILGMMSEKASEYSHRTLQKMGVELKLNTQLKEYDGEQATLSTGETIDTQILIWSAGVIGNPLPGLREESLHKNLRYKVDKFNRVIGYENIFAIGDVAALAAEFGSPHPMLAPVAIQQANNLVRNMNLTTPERWKEFSYLNKGVLATIGRNKAVADFGKLHFNSFIAWVIWVFVHLMTLVGFRNRIIVFINWVINYFTFDSSIRLIIRPLQRQKAAEPAKY